MHESTLSHDAADARLIHGWNPITGERLDPGYAEATAGAVESAVLLANAAFEAGPTPALIRARLLTEIATAIEELGQELIDVARAETALPEPRLLGERKRTVDQLRMFAGVVEEGAWLDARIEFAQPDRTPAPRPDLRSMLAPVGPVVVFGASNFPFAFSTAGGDTASALAAGCPVIFKAHPAHPQTSELVASAIHRAVAKVGLHAGAFGHLHGRENVGRQLVSHPLIRSVAFTGSFRGGHALWQLANARPEPIPVFAEMGSVNPVFILPNALGDRGETLAKEFAGALTLGVGQFCTNPGIAVAIDGPELAAWKGAFKAALEAVNPQPMLTPGIAGSYLEGGERLARDAEAVMRGPVVENRVAPALFEVDSTRFLANPDLQEEVFGPTCLLVTCKDAADMKLVANALRGQLTATIQTQESDHDLEATLTTVLARKAGRVIRNGFPTGVEVGDAIHHGGPFPATTDARFTSVGTRAILRFARPVCYQGTPQDMLPPELQDANPLGIRRRLNGQPPA